MHLREEFFTKICIPTDIHFKMIQLGRMHFWSFSASDMIWLAVFIVITMTTAAQEVDVGDIEEGRVLKVLNSNCSCPDHRHCECCATLSNSLFNIRDPLCGNWEFRPATLQILSNFTWRNKTVYSAQLSPDNTPPVCFPIIPQILLSACLRLNDVQQHLVLNEGGSGGGVVVPAVEQSTETNDNQLVHACTNATVRLFFYDLFSIRLGCIDVTNEGINVSPSFRDYYSISNFPNVIG